MPVRVPNFYDINKFPANGYLIFPLSMSRLQTGQAAEQIYNDLVFFNKKIPKISLDVIFLYTAGLYMHSEEKATDVRQKIIGQMLDHKAKLLSIILKKREFVPQAFHFITWDSVLLNTEKFSETLLALKKLRKSDKEFQKLLEIDLKEKQKNETTFTFLIEEITITHLLRQKFIPLNHALATSEGWRLIVYPGDYMKADAYAYRKGFLPRNKAIKKDDVFSHAHYDLNKRLLIDFDKL